MKLRAALLAWYDRAGRELPWRNRQGRGEPYRVWLSEIMLQQTTVASVRPYFEKFLQLFPDVDTMARAPREDLLGAWAGLGYYSRARNLHAAAQMLAAQGFPETEETLRALPGVGPYTAAAIAAIAFDQPANVVDGNVERVMARLYAVEAPLPQAKSELRALAGALVGPERPGDWAQALMDLGATVCTPRKPQCGSCPWQEACAAYAAGAPESYPRKTAKAAKPERHGVAFLLCGGNLVWLVRRPDRGLLGGMEALPTTPWREEIWPRAEALLHAPIQANWRPAGAVRHVFTHFTLELEVWRAEASDMADLKGGRWTEVGAISDLPTVFKKAALAGAQAAKPVQAKRARKGASPPL